jgi:vancomycin resistance protein YoaR
MVDMSKRRLVLLISFALTIVCGLVWGLGAYLSDRIYFGVQVWDTSLGGMRIDEASSVLRDGPPVLYEPVITLRGPDRSWGVRPADLGITLVAEDTARMAYQVGREPEGGPLVHLWLMLFGTNVAPIFSYDETVATLYLQELAAEVDIAPVDAALVLEGVVPSVTPPQSGLALNVPASLAAIRAGLSDVVGLSVNLVVEEVSPQVLDAEMALVRAEELLSEQLTLLLPDPRQGDPGPWVLSPEDLAGILTTFEVDGRLYSELDQLQLWSYLEGLVPTLAIEPVNSRFHFDESTGQLEAITPSAEGRALDVGTSLQNILDALEAGHHLAPLAVHTLVPPYPDYATAEELGIRELVAEGDSYFIGSPSGRDHNIRLATSQFDGLIIGPGETFSFNHYLGDVSEEAGYDESFITAGEQLAVEVGGGICQVSTTVFRAALWGGYDIVERTYHYQRVGYYELMGYGPGFDATVYSPLVDLKFVNNYETPLLIEAEIEEKGHRLVFRFYSTADGRTVEVEGPEIADEVEPGPPIYELDEELEPETVIEWQGAQEGLTATVIRWVRDSAGELMYRDEFVSRYEPRRAAFHYGPGYVPPVE